MDNPENKAALTGKVYQELFDDKDCRCLMFGLLFCVSFFGINPVLHLVCVLGPPSSPPPPNCDRKLAELEYQTTKLINKTQRLNRPDLTR